MEYTYGVDKNLRDFVLKQRQIGDEIMMIGKLVVLKEYKKEVRIAEWSTRNRLNEFS